MTDRLIQEDFEPAQSQGIRTGKVLEYWYERHVQPWAASLFVTEGW